MGLATLGWALPVANGMAVAAPGRRVVATCGDGGFLFTATELATAVAHQLDVTVLVHDLDAAFGSIGVLPGAPLRQGLRVRPADPDLVLFGRSFESRPERVDDVAELPAAMARATAEPGPSMVVLGAPLDSRSAEAVPRPRQARAGPRAPRRDAPGE